jgi:hypothetical protein
MIKEKSFRKTKTGGTADREITSLLVLIRVGFTNGFIR